MKKLITGVIVTVVIFAAGFASSAIIRNITESRVVVLGIEVTWNPGMTEIIEVVLVSKAITLDDAGIRAGGTLERTAFNDLAPQVQAGISNLIKHQGKVQSTKIGEDKEPVVPMTMPGKKK